MERKRMKTLTNSFKYVLSSLFNNEPIPIGYI